MTARFLRAVVTVVALFVATPAAAAPAKVDSVVLVAATEERPAPPALRARSTKRKPPRVPKRARLSKQAQAQKRTLGSHLGRIARVMMIAAAGIGPAPPPPPLPEPAKVEQVAEDSNGDEED